MELWLSIISIIISFSACAVSIVALCKNIIRIKFNILQKNCAAFYDNSYYIKGQYCFVFKYKINNCSNHSCNIFISAKLDEVETLKEIKSLPPNTTKEGFISLKFTNPLDNETPMATVYYEVNGTIKSLKPFQIHKTEKSKCPEPTKD
ncbi:MAG: hypothetical protein RR348_00580 [Clostridia bacterium]